MLGGAFALGSALFWAFAVILFKKSGETFSPIALNVYKSVVAIIALVITMAVLRIPFFPELPVSDVLLLVLSGFVGITLADIFFFAALNRLGAGMTAVVECFYLPSVLVFSYFLLDEHLSPGGLCGSALVVSAILVGTVGRKGLRSVPGSVPISGAGVAAGILSMILLALGIVMIKEVLPRVDVFWATAVRVGAGCIALFAIVAVHPSRRRIMDELKPSPAWFTALPASVSGNVIALVCWVAGMKYTTASKAATLNQMSTIFIFLLAAVWLKERITPKKMIAIGLALTGAYLTLWF